MSRTVRLGLALAALCAAGHGGRSFAAGLPCPSMLPNCPSSVSGKDGPYIQQIAKQQKPGGAGQTTGAAPALNLSEHALNRGELSGGLMHMPTTEAELDALLARLRSGWPYPTSQPPIHVHMRASTEYAAAAHPDNTLVVNFGLIRDAKSDDELAWVLGHELGHFLLGHFVQDQQMIQRLQMVQHAGELAAAGSVLSQQRVQANGSQLQVYTADQRAIQHAENINAAKSEQLRELLSVVDPVFGRNQEDQADAIGVDLGVRATLAADEGEARAFDVLIDAEKRKAAKVKSLQDDLGRVAANSITPKASASLGAGDVVGAATGFFNSFRDNLVQHGLNTAMDYATKNHRSPQVRKDSLGAYFNAAYRDQAPVEPTTRLLQRIRSSAEYRDADVAVTAHDAAQDARIAGDSSAALKAIQKAFRTRFASAPFIANEAGAIYEELGENVEAERRYQQADASGDQTIDGYQLHVGLLVRLGQDERALTKIHEAEQRLGDHEAFLPSLIVISLRRGKGEEAANYVHECMETEDKDLRKLCEYALLNPADKKRIEAMSPEQRAKIDRSLEKAGSKVSTASVVSGLGAPPK